MFKLKPTSADALSQKTASQTKVSVILEYNWTSNRDCVADVVAACLPDSSEILIGSVLDSMQEMGFELEPDYRISYFKPTEQLYLYLGKVSDLLTSRSVTLKGALKDNTLTLLVREASNSRSSGSASKICSPFVTPITKEASEDPE